MSSGPAQQTARQAEDDRPASALTNDWSAVVEAVPAALIVTDEQGCILSFNAGASRWLGWAVEDVIGHDIDMLLLDKGGGLFQLTAGEPAQMKGEVRRIIHLAGPDGGAILTDVSTNSVRRSGGLLFTVMLRQPELLAGMSEGWNDAEERLATVAANLPGIIFQRVMQADGKVYYPFFSAGVKDVLGFHPDEMLPAADGSLDCLHWADRDGYLKRMKDSARTLSPYTEELRCISVGGELRWLSGTLRPEGMPNGDVIWDGVLIDITDRMRAELRLEIIMDHAADCVVTLGDDGLIETANPATEKVFAYGLGDLIGQPVARLMAEPTHFQSVVEETDSGQLNGALQEMIGLRSDGSRFPIELALSEVLMEGRRLYIAIIRDITTRRETEARLRETEERLLNIADNIQGIVFQRLLTPDGAVKFSYISEGCRPILGLEAEDLLADSNLFMSMMDSGDRLQYMDGMRRSAELMEPMEADIKMFSRSGEEVWLRSLSRPRRLASGAMVWDGVALDVTGRKKAEDELIFLAYNDPMTGLGNRSLFIERFARAKTFAERIKAGVGVLSFGLDRFSIINATLGHMTGDKVLRAASKAIHETVDMGDLLCRAGGDRFLLMLSGITDSGDVETAVDAIRKRFETPLQVDGQEFDLTVSVGAALFPTHGDSADTLIMHAEAALQRAKQHGASSFQMFTEDMGTRANNELTMQHRIRRALENEEFVAFFQPQVETRTGRIVGMEALARWISPEHGLVPPGAFIEVAEEYGLIDAMCEQVMRDACRWNRKWWEAGLAQVPVAVNISGRQFHNARRLVALVDSVQRESGLDPVALELELTESSAMTDPENAIAVVQQLADRGIACAIDDFGTGYSSLSVLKRFPIRKLKIDRSFINEITTDKGDAAIVIAMIGMAGALNLKVVAEGVETQEQLNFLHGVGCDQIQGFFYFRPLPGDQMEAIFRDKPQLVNSN